MSSTSSFSPTVATLHVAIGGAVGAVLRYQLGRAMTVWLGGPAMSIFPWATLAVNALGSGLFAGGLSRSILPNNAGGGGPPQEGRAAQCEWWPLLFLVSATSSKSCFVSGLNQRPIAVALPPGAFRITVAGPGRRVRQAEQVVLGSSGLKTTAPRGRDRGDSRWECTDLPP